jgi:hypothetical protein
MTNEMPKIESLDGVVVDTVERIKIGNYEGPAYEKIHNENLLLINGKLAYIAETADGNQVVNFGGVEGPRYKRIISDIENLDGRLVYTAETADGKQVANLNGKEVSSEDPEQSKILLLLAYMDGDQI